MVCPIDTQHAPSMLNSIKEVHFPPFSVPYTCMWGEWHTPAAAWLYNGGWTILCGLVKAHSYVYY